MTEMTRKENIKSQLWMRGRWILLGLMGLALVSCHDAPRGNPLDPGGTPAVEIQVSQDAEATTATLTWTQYGGPAPFAEYRVLRNIAKAVEVDTLAVIGDVGQTSFVDTALVDNVPYTYRVSVVNGSGFEFPSQESEQVHGPIGPRIAFYSNQAGNMEVMAINPDGTGLVNLTNHPAGEGPPEEGFGSGAGRPSWSPDGGKIAFVSNRDGNDEIYVMDAFGGNPINLTNHPSRDREPSWSPDGSKIAFVSDRDGNNEIYVMNADGSNTVPLSRGHSPWWSSDGAQLVFIFNDGTPELHVMDADGSNRVKIGSGSRGWDPMWSPDGKYILTWHSADEEIVMMNPDGSGEQRWSGGEIGPVGPSMGPDGRIAISGRVESNSEILLFSSTGEFLKRLTFDLAFDGWPSWSPIVE